jgi:spore coat protein H
MMPLPVRIIRISDSAFEDLESNIWNERYVKAMMLTNGRAVPVTIRYRGGHTRDYPKRSYEVIRKGQAFHYNAEFDDPSMIRNALSFSFFPLLGVPAPRTKHVLLLINDQPQGIYLEIEGVDSSFFRRRRIGVSSLFYAVNNLADFGLYHPESNHLKSSLLSGYEYKWGPAAEKIKLKSFIRGLNVRQGKLFHSFIQSRLDVNNYLSWLAGAVLTGNYDGFEQNYAIYRSRLTGKWRIIPWDYEGTWGRNCYGRAVASDLVAITGYNHLTRRLLAIPSYRRQYKAILQKALNGPFTERQLIPRVERMTTQIAPYIREDRTRRWSTSDFQGEKNVIRSYIRERRAIVKADLKHL